jgi:hypothetical protein
MEFFVFFARYTSTDNLKVDAMVSADGLQLKFIFELVQNDTQKIDTLDINSDLFNEASHALRQFDERLKAQFPTQNCEIPQLIENNKSCVHSTTHAIGQVIVSVYNTSVCALQQPVVLQVREIFHFEVLSNGTNQQLFSVLNITISNGSLVTMIGTVNENQSVPQSPGPYLAMTSEAALVLDETWSNPFTSSNIDASLSEVEVAFSKHDMTTYSSIKPLNLKVAQLHMNASFNAVRRGMNTCFTAGMTTLACAREISLAIQACQSVKSLVLADVAVNDASEILVKIQSSSLLTIQLDDIGPGRDKWQIQHTGHSNWASFAAKTSKVACPAFVDGQLIFDVRASGGSLRILTAHAQGRYSGWTVPVAFGALQSGVIQHGQLDYEVHFPGNSSSANVTLCALSAEGTLYNITIRAIHLGMNWSSIGIFPAGVFGPGIDENPLIDTLRTLIGSSKNGEKESTLLTNAFGEISQLPNDMRAKLQALYYSPNYDGKIRSVSMCPPGIFALNLTINSVNIKVQPVVLSGVLHKAAIIVDAINANSDAAAFVTAVTNRSTTEDCFTLSLQETVPGRIHSFRFQFLNHTGTKVQMSAVSWLPMMVDVTNFESQQGMAMLIWDLFGRQELAFVPQQVAKIPSTFVAGCAPSYMAGYCKDYFTAVVVPFFIDHIESIDGVPVEPRLNASWLLNNSIVGNGTLTMRTVLGAQVFLVDSHVAPPTDHVVNITTNFVGLNSTRDLVHLGQNAVTFMVECQLRPSNVTANPVEYGKFSVSLQLEPGLPFAAALTKACSDQKKPFDGSFRVVTKNGSSLFNTVDQVVLGVNHFFYKGRLAIPLAVNVTSSTVPGINVSLGTFYSTSEVLLSGNNVLSCFNQFNSKKCVCCLIRLHYEQDGSLQSQA